MARSRPKQKTRAVPDPEMRFRRTVDELILRLRHIQSAVIVAVAALRRQNCELDEDIASLLQRCVCDRIDEQIEKLEMEPCHCPSAAAGPPVSAPLRGRSPARGHLKHPR